MFVLVSRPISWVRKRRRTTSLAIEDMSMSTRSPVSSLFRTFNVDVGTKTILSSCTLNPSTPLIKTTGVVPPACLIVVVSPSRVLILVGNPMFWLLANKLTISWFFVFVEITTMFPLSSLFRTLNDADGTKEILLSVTLYPNALLI